MPVKSRAGLDAAPGRPSEPRSAGSGDPTRSLDDRLHSTPGGPLPGRVTGTLPGCGGPFYWAPTRIDRTFSLNRLTSHFVLEWAQFEQVSSVLARGRAGDEIVRVSEP